MAARKGKGGGVGKIVWLVIGGIFLLGIGIFLGALLFSSEEFFNGGIDQDNIKNLKDGNRISQRSGCLLICQKKQKTI